MYSIKASRKRFNNLINYLYTISKKSYDFISDQIENHPKVILGVTVGIGSTVAAYDLQSILNFPIIPIAEASHNADKVINSCKGYVDIQSLKPLHDPGDKVKVIGYVREHTYDVIYRLIDVVNDKVLSHVHLIGDEIKNCIVRPTVIGEIPKDTDVPVLKAEITAYPGGNDFEWIVINKNK